MKVKVGVGRRRRPRGGRARGGRARDVALRLDANGAWDGDEAEANLAPRGRPGSSSSRSRSHGVAAFRDVARPRAVPRGDGRDGGRAGRARLGRRRRGVPEDRALRRDRRHARGRARSCGRPGAEVYLASTCDGPAGIAAALHVAAALRVELPCGLATLPGRCSRRRRTATIARAATVPGLGLPD